MMARSATIMMTVVVSICAALNLAVLGFALVHPFALNSDFMAFWSFPRFAAGHGAALIYDAAALMGYQQTLYPGFHSFYPYLYPPTLLVVTWWLKSLSFAAAQMVWTAAGLAVFAAAVLAMFRPRRWLVLLALLASPASLLNGVTGETAYFTSALLFAGFAALPMRPVLSGVFFGLLTLKPQLGVLIPFLLMARGEWRTILAAALTAGLLAGASCIAFPPGLWLVWAHTLPVYQAQYFAGHGLNLNIIVTPAANLRAMGIPGSIAWGVQLFYAAAMVAAVMFAARRAPLQIAAAVLLVASFLAVPHAYAYDSLTLTGAMALCLTRKTPVWQVALGCLMYLGPLLLLTPASHLFLYAGPETMLLGCMMPLALRRGQGEASVEEPRAVAAT